MKRIDERRFDFVPKYLWTTMSKNDKDNLRNYRLYFRHYNDNDKMIEKLDKDGDGLLSFVEMQAARKAPNTDRMFKHLDNDGDGMISAEEFASVKERGHKGRKKNKP